MRNPLDLNNFPDDFTRDHGKQPLDDSSSSASGIYRKKKNGAKDESAKVYECRFCSLKFCKSQALGGHMNRHRQERETETLNRARQLVFSNDNLLPQLPHPHQLGGQAVVQGGFHHHHPQAAGCNTVYPTRLFSGGGNSTTILPPSPSQGAAPPHMYTSPAASRLNIYPPSHDYFIGHVCSSNHQPFSLQTPPPDNTSTTTTTTNYACIGAPVGQTFPLGGGTRDMSPSSANRYHQDHGF